jgi:ABC-2 type transport system ATP-binding protein/lipopolysaccharide transport system ATP-binding protein
MSPPAIAVENVSKRYLLGEHYAGTLRDALSQQARLLLRREGPSRDELWALRDVSLEVAEGETLGIIGRNGAGKSTLLKILTRITEPSSGVSRTRGRVGSLLEVGTGFHPELTGRENVYLNGAILGMARREIAGRFDEIVEFSGVERFIDTPVKRYSSGMYLRLAFAVAAHLECEIMLVDEVLAVGDAEFQRKCLGKMSGLEREGRTVVFVSHNLDSVVRLCRKTAWLDRGALREYGPSEEVAASYLAATAVPGARATLTEQEGQAVALTGLAVLGPDGVPATTLQRDLPFTVEVSFAVRERVPGLDFTIFVETLRGVRVLDEAWTDANDEQTAEPGDYVARVTIPPILNAGDYSVGFYFGSAYGGIASDEDVIRFRLEGDAGGRSERLVQLNLPWELERVGHRLLTP